MVSTVTALTDVSPVTQTSLTDAIKAAWVSTLGYTAIDDYTVSTTRNLVFQKSLGLGKTYDNVYFQISVTSGLIISQIFHTGWNASTHVGTNSGSAGVQVTFVNTSPVSMKTFRSNSGEFDFLVVYQNLTSHILGWFRPATLNNVDENFYCTFLHWQNFFNSMLFRGVGAAASLLGETQWAVIHGNISLTNHYNKNDIIPRLIIYSSGKSVLGITSDDIALGAGNGLGLFATVGDWIKVWNGGASYSSIFLK
ncbi:hypothetical protein [Tolypothrix sp. PCC 7601]|uniref:hypothetical protein n=1 Tax=Tolypothrix sp. PCC 7601 TaxID=1188 RepID=UPI0005EAAB5C|nr:hypothetical protein [Tolypothrix sp. PCC 7601]EKE98964.1 hypothetical protein FDUTEX481_03152 [Tolypothrix sp. PCC 7601]UYD35647.1 hypothetical protein HG267_07755 [Tolypothrix sp. PCC 7601]BAY94789.1 hypothetical protein NIES3275_68430 [Microchaete diplosiphon NIES-3275]